MRGEARPSRKAAKTHPMPEWHLFGLMRILPLGVALSLSSGARRTGLAHPTVFLYACFPSRTITPAQFEKTTGSLTLMATLPLVSVARTFKVCGPFVYLVVSSE